MKLLFSSFDCFSGISTVALQKGNNIFVGTTKVLDEDRDVLSSFMGCYFAELKATVKMMKHDYQEAKKELKVLKDSYNQLTQLRNFPYEKHSQGHRHLRKQIKIKEKQVQELKHRYECIEDNYINIVEERIAASRNFPKVLAKVGKRDIKWVELGEEFGFECDIPDIKKVN